MINKSEDDLQRVGDLYPGAMFAVMWAEARIEESWWEGARAHLMTGGSVECVIESAAGCLLDSAQRAIASGEIGPQVVQCYKDSLAEMNGHDWRRYVMGKLGMM